MRIAVLTGLVLAACTHPATPTCPPPPPVAAATPTPPIPDKDALAKRTHDFLDAYDRAEIAKVEPQLSEHLMHFEGGAAKTRDQELAKLSKRKPGDSFIARRTWSDEQVHVTADDAVFIGKALEVQGGNDKHGGYKFAGWYTVSWAREGDAWRVRLWTWQHAGQSSKTDFWNDVYRNDSGFEKRPNALLVEVTKGLKPGTALDLAMGQGRNALYLASIGWKTTGIDFAEEGVRAARKTAADNKLELSTVQGDIDTYDFGTNKWDLISMIYPGDNHEPWIEKAKVGLKKNGLFVLEFFAGDPADPDDGGYMPGQLAKLFADGFTILRDDTFEGTPDWAMDHAKLVRFVAKKIR